MNHTCSGCGYRVEIPKEWILAGKDEKICCQICGKKVKLNIQKHVGSKNIPTRTDTGTVITSTQGSDWSQESFQLTISNSNSMETLAIKELMANKVYIVGRNADKIKAVDSTAEPILIPTQFDPAVSRVHFEIRVASDQFKNQLVIKDLNSMHKTRLVGADQTEVLEAWEQVYLDPSDKVKIGRNTLITFSKNSI
ncbi:FHA domain-containing protein [Flagellimonas myxillae]|uniref:FHA domain-containing protein n=1 Tax=Flagellimonas myxillae TaxID=2942214 RepID=UPI00201F3D4B|nr:FHA domain-containing protein [Muricauda myxillae]MCL6265066.1 FHA domain-containing protein [Muricauda myxillae]